jgi:hypothetical protein
MAWEAVVRGLAEPVAASRISPKPGHADVYHALMRRYTDCEAQALGLTSKLA